MNTRGVVRLVAGAGLGLVAVIAVLTACGADDDGGAAQGDGGVVLGPDGAPVGTSPPAPAEPIPIEKFQDAFIDAFCTPQEACCQQEGLEFVAGGCAALLRQADAGTAAGGPNLPFAVPEGSTYDPQAAGDCLAFYREFAKAANTLCQQPAQTMTPGQTEDEFTVAQQRRLAEVSPIANALNPVVQACTKVFVGTKPIGAECAGPWECAPPGGSYSMGAASCSQTRLNGGGGPNICRYSVFVAEGQPCTDTSVNDERTCFAPTSSATFVEEMRALYCEPATKTCKRGTPVADGQPCDRNGGTYCGPKSFCDDTCKPLGAAGAGCDNDDECLAGLCKEGQCAERAGVGEPCTQSEDCTTSHCSPATKKCTMLVAGYTRPQTCSGKPN